MLHQYFGFDGFFVAAVLKCINDALLMLCSKCFDRHFQLYLVVPVDADKLVMFQTDDIALLVGNDLRYMNELARLVRQHDGNREDPVSHNQAVLNHVRNRDDVRIAPAQDRDNFLVPAVQML